MTERAFLCVGGEIQRFGLVSIAIALAAFPHIGLPNRITEKIVQE
jgi:hypothetical protein